MAIVSLPAVEVGKAERLSELPPEPALRKAVTVSTHLAEDIAFREEWICPFLKHAERARDWYIAYRHDDPGSLFSLHICVWPRGVGLRFTTILLGVLTVAPPALIEARAPLC